MSTHDPKGDPRTLPKLPSLALGEIFALRDELVREAAFGHENATLRGRSYEAFVADIAKHLKPKGVERETIHDSCRDVLDVELTPERLLDLAWRLAGNLAVLRRGEAVHPWAAQHDLEWMPLAIAKVDVGRNRFDAIGAWLTFQVLAGTACPRAVKQFWSREQCGFFATFLGFRRRGPRVKSPMPYSHPLQLVRLRLYGLFEPALSRDKPGFKQIKVGPTMVAHNEAILRIRYRHEPCPRGWEHPCIACTIGYLLPADNVCKAATHPTQWYADYCPACEQDDRPFDDTSKSTVCVDCTRKRRLAPKGEG